MAQPDARASSSAKAKGTGCEGTTKRTPHHRGGDQTYPKPNNAACNGASCLGLYCEPAYLGPEFILGFTSALLRFAIALERSLHSGGDGPGPGLHSAGNSPGPGLRRTGHGPGSGLYTTGNGPGRLLHKVPDAGEKAARSRAAGLIGVSRAIGLLGRCWAWIRLRLGLRLRMFLGLVLGRNHRRVHRKANCNQRNTSGHEQQTLLHGLFTYFPTPPPLSSRYVQFPVCGTSRLADRNHIYCTQDPFEQGI